MTEVQKFVRLKSLGRVLVKRINGGMEPPEEPPVVNFAFVSSVLLPDGTPDVHFRVACGGQKLRDIMLDSNIELYGPYSRPLLNCGGVGTCGTCIVEVSSWTCDWWNCLPWIDIDSWHHVVDTEFFEYSCLWKLFVYLRLQYSLLLLYGQPTFSQRKLRVPVLD